MSNRYQVFVSSTYEDLIDERLEVIKALLELDWEDWGQTCLLTLVKPGG